MGMVSWQNYAKKIKAKQEECLERGEDFVESSDEPTSSEGSDSSFDSEDDDSYSGSDSQSRSDSEMEEIPEGDSKYTSESSSDGEDEDHQYNRTVSDSFQDQPSYTPSRLNLENPAHNFLGGLPRGSSKQSDSIDLGYTPNKRPSAIEDHFSKSPFELSLSHHPSIASAKKET